MSMVGLPSNHQPEKMFQKSLHHHPRNDSGELDVFEAAKYFSGANEIYGYHHATKDEERSRTSRMSLDMPFRRNAQTTIVTEKNMIKEKKHKQPSSPGGKLASFLNSLFNQTSSKKKKSKNSLKNEDELVSSVWRRKRRSSISHFHQSSTTTTNSLLSAGFRTPPPYTIAQITPTKSSSLNFSKPKGNGFLEEKIQESKWGGDQYLKEENEFKKFDKDDEGGAESDTSDDLFELPNYDLDCFSSSSGLPVYETTNMGSIKRSTAIST